MLLLLLFSLLLLLLSLLLAVEEVVVSDVMPVFVLEEGAGVGAGAGVGLSLEAGGGEGLLLPVSPVGVAGLAGAGAGVGAGAASSVLVVRRRAPELKPLEPSGPLGNLSTPSGTGREPWETRFGRNGGLDPTTGEAAEAADAAAAASRLRCTHEVGGGDPSWNSVQDLLLGLFLRASTTADSSFRFGDCVCGSERHLRRGKRGMGCMGTSTSGPRPLSLRLLLLTKLFLRLGGPLTGLPYPELLDTLFLRLLG